MVPCTTIYYIKENVAYKFFFKNAYIQNIDISTGFWETGFQSQSSSFKKCLSCARTNFCNKGTSYDNIKENVDHNIFYKNAYTLNVDISTDFWENRLQSKGDRFKNCHSCTVLKILFKTL